jgi:mRNA interferase HigB
MRIITKRRIEEARVLHPECATALLGWYKIVKNNEFKSYADLKASFNSVDKVRDLYVFYIGRNKLRLIASIHFNRRKLYIRHILTHKEYAKGDWRK